jgi:hypothetical protein
MTRLEKLRRWESIREIFAIKPSKLVTEFHNLSKDLFGEPKNSGPHKNGWSIEDSARELGKSVSFVRKCQAQERK